ncbi:YncE family protein [Acetobacter cerevisiae]|uniref:YncE family protein n=1 Tax=Acetobacter cerevisiae TaxID=178900 RepID=A0ABT1ENA4_9PROT|nr:YncE family protein [Acetobacter cerevisiae]MCP1244862.1 YncE family protein [Acetobacter cerevisiae]MCP1254439.1 YncE family protein [Acetobacter cerevisiae]
MVVKRHLAAATAVFVALGAGTGLAVAQEASQSPVQTTAPSAAPQPAPAQVPASQGSSTQPVVSAPAAPTAVQTIPGMPPVINPANLYSETAPDHINPEVAQDPARVYVPNLRSNDVSVIDPATSKVVDRFPVGKSPQHVVPSWDLRTLWVTNNAEGTTNGSLTPIDARTGKPGPAVAVDDPYNMYFTPDGKSAIVVAEARKRLDFRDPHTMALQQSVETPDCKGVNHADFSIDGRYAIFTCEFGGHLVKVDTVNKTVMGYLKLSSGGMPQDILISPNGKTFYVADMMADGVFMVDGDSFKEIGFIPTGVGTHGLYPSRDGTKMYVANRGSHKIHGKPHSKAGGVTVIDFATNKIVANWPIPEGGSPDMGNVSADGKTLWLSGRFDDVAYQIDTEDGSMKKIPVGAEPHGLTVWPQPGRYSIGHTGILR